MSALLFSIISIQASGQGCPNVNISSSAGGACTVNLTYFENSEILNPEWFFNGISEGITNTIVVGATGIYTLEYQFEIEIEGGEMEIIDCSTSYTVIYGTAVGQIPFACVDNIVDYLADVTPEYYWTFEPAGTEIPFGGTVINENDYTVLSTAGSGLDLINSRHLDCSSAGIGPSTTNNIVDFYSQTQDLILSDTDPECLDIQLTNEFTIELLAKVDVESGHTEMWALTTSGGNLRGFKLHIGGGDYAMIYGLDLEDSYNFNFQRTINLSEIENLDVLGGNHGGWHHYVFTMRIDYDTQFMALYIDGIKVDESTDFIDSETDLTDFSANFHVGDTKVNRSASANPYGHIDELAIYSDQILSDEMIYQHFSDALENNSHYSFVPTTPHQNIPTYYENTIYRQMEFPIGYLQNESSVNPEEENTETDDIEWLENPVDQLKNFPSPRYAFNHRLKENFPWYDLRGIAGNQENDGDSWAGGIDDCNYVTNGVDITEQFITKYHYGILLPKREPSICISNPDKYELQRRIANLANEHPAVPLTAHFRHADVNISPYDSPNILNYFLSESHYYNPESYFPQHSFASGLTPYWLDGYNQAYSKYYGIQLSGGNLLNRKFNMINENGESDPFHRREHNFVSSQNSDMIWEPDQEKFDLLWSNNETISNAFPSGLPNLSSNIEDEVDEAYESWWEFVAENITSGKSSFLAGVKGHAAFSDADVSYFSVDGKGGHQGVWPNPNQRLKWDIIKHVGTPFNNSYYATPDFYPVISDWIGEGGNAGGHGLDWVENSRRTELSLGYSNDKDRFFSPFINPGFSEEPKDNMRPGQYLGLIKIMGMLGAEFYYPSWFPDGNTYIQNPRNFIWSFTIPSYAQAVMSRSEEYLFDADILLHESQFESETPESVYTVAYIRKIIGEERYLVYGNKQRISSQHSPGNLSLDSEILLLKNEHITTPEELKINASLQGSTYIYDRTSVNPVFYQLDGWHEPWHPSWWEKGFLLESEMFDDSNIEPDLHTLIPIEDEVFELASSNTSDFTEYITYTEIGSGGSLSYYFNPFGALDNELFNFNIYIKSTSKDLNTASIGVKVIDENDELVYSSSLCLPGVSPDDEDGYDWKWYDVNNDCSDCDLDLCELTQQKYTLILNPTENALVDVCFLEAVAHENSYYMQNQDFGSLVNVQTQIIPKLYPSFLEKFGTIPETSSNQCTANNTPYFEVESNYCEGDIIINNLSEIDTSCDEDVLYTWTLTNLNDNSTFTFESFNFTQTLNVTHDVNFSLTLTYNEIESLPEFFTVYDLPNISTVPDQINGVHGQTVSIETTLMLDGEDVTNDWSYSWFPEIWAVDGNTESNLINIELYNPGYEAETDVQFNTNYTVTATNSIGCQLETQIPVLIDPCIVDLVFSELDELEDAYIDSYENLTFLHIENGLETVPDIFDLNLYSSFEVLMSMDCLSMVEVEGQVQISIDYTEFSGYGMLQFEITDQNGCKSLEELYVSFVNRGCIDPRAANYDIGAIDFDLPEGMEPVLFQGFDTEIYLDILNTPSCTEPCIGQVDFATAIPDDFTPTGVWFENTGTTQSPAYVSADPNALCHGNYLLVVDTDYGCLYSKTFNIVHPLETEVIIKPPSCLIDEGIITLDIETDYTSILWYEGTWLNNDIPDENYLYLNDQFSDVQLPVGDYTVLIDYPDCGQELINFSVEYISGCAEGNSPLEPLINSSTNLNLVNSLNHFLYQDLVISSDFSGSISGANFCFLPGKSLIIEEGAIVSFYNCNFSSCGIWEGIKIVCSETSDLSAVSQIQIDGGSISNANIAFFAQGNNDEGSLLGFYSTGVTFEDNLQGIFLWNINEAPINNDLNSVTNCTFNRTEDWSYKFQDPNYFENQHVNYWKVNGMNIGFSTFQNDNYINHQEFSQLGKGICMRDSETRINHNDFQNLERGVSISVFESGLQNVIVDGNNIERCQVGIYSIIHHGHSIINNTINLGELMVSDDTGIPFHPLDFDFDEREGIVAIGGGLMDIQENTVMKVSVEQLHPSILTIGIRARDIRHDDIIRNNSLSDLHYGNLANGSNVDPDDQSLGLRYLCNQNSGNEFDFAVAGFDLWFQDLEVAIKPEQKDVIVDQFGENQDFPTGNTLSDPINVTTHLQFDHRGSQNDVVYRYYENINYPDHELENYDNVEPDEHTSFVDIDALCSTEIITVEDLEEGIVNIDGEISDAEGKITFATLELNTAEYLYISLIDEGDTEALRDEVEFTWSDDVWEMRDRLLDMSPNVSTRVAYDVADRTQIFPHPVALDIFLANPHLARDIRFLKHLESKAYPMPEYMIELLYNTPPIATLRKELEQKISQASTVKLAAENRLVHLLQLQGADRSDIYGVVANMNTTTSDMLMVDYELENGNFTAADANLVILNERMFEKDPIIRTELEQYTVWYELRKGMLMDGRDFDQITPTEHQTIEGLALQYFFTSAGKKAVSYLDFYEDIWFIPPAYDSDHQFSFRSMAAQYEEGFSVKVYPNPSSVIINFDIQNNLTSGGNAWLTIYDSAGRLIHNQTVKNYESIITLETAKWSSGLYSYQFTSNDEILKTDNFEIIR